MLMWIMNLHFAATESATPVVTVKARMVSLLTAQRLTGIEQPKK